MLPYVFESNLDTTDPRVNSAQLELFTNFDLTDIRSVDESQEDPLQQYDKYRTSEVFYHRLFYMEAQKILR